MVCFDGVHAFGYNSAGSEPINMPLDTEVGFSAGDIVLDDTYR